METTTLGKTGLEVSRLGIGLVKIGQMEGPDKVERAGRLLNAALDAGINFLDTSACYGISEEQVGNSVAHRRGEYNLATKCGHVTGGYSGEPWTAETIEHSIDRSLKRLKTDHVDLVQLHSCSLDILKRGEVIDALDRAKEAGKTRFIGYSGDEEEAAWAIESGRFDTLQTSLNIVDQHARRDLLGPAEARGMGIIIKRPIGNGIWGAKSKPSGTPDGYVVRAQEMARLGPIPGAPDDPTTLALGFIFAHPEVDTAIVGTGNPSHLRSNIELLERGVALSPETLEELHSRFDKLDDGWRGWL